jgi:alpha-tubulin suppressor-like RCC1 family protein
MPQVVVDLGVGDENTCIVRDDGAIYCWGTAARGALGHAGDETIGDDEPANVSTPVGLDDDAILVRVGRQRACALTVDAQVFCWGAGSFGALGYGDVADVGDDEAVAAKGSLGLPDTVDLCVGEDHACAIDSMGDLRCWGRGADGRLGQGAIHDLGDDETLDEVPPVAVGGRAVRVACGARHTCAVLSDGVVVCWGGNESGQLGYGNGTEAIGDDEVPSTMGTVALSGSAKAVTAGDEHSCALLTSGQIECWGRGAIILGAEAEDVGDDEDPAGAGMIATGVVARAVTAGNAHTCLLSEQGQIRCWGVPTCALGYGVPAIIDVVPPTPEAYGDVLLPSDVTQVVAAQDATCALIASGELFCWGAGYWARLGYGYSPYGICLGDETPSMVGPVPL